MGVYSLGIVLDCFVFASPHLMRALIVYKMYTHTHACMHTFTQQNTYIHVYMHAYTHRHACMHIYIHNTYTHIHTNTCMHTHTHRHAHMYTYPQPYHLSKLKVNCLQVPGPIFWAIVWWDLTSKSTWISFSKVMCLNSLKWERTGNPAKITLA